MSATKPMMCICGHPMGDHAYMGGEGAVCHNACLVRCKVARWDGKPYAVEVEA